MQIIPKEKLKSSKIKDRLDLVETVFRIKQRTDLNKVILIGAQHILPSTLTMLQSFFDRGLHPDNVFLIGKCYSTDMQTLSKLRNLGVYVCRSSIEFDPSKPFDSLYTSNIKSFINKISPYLSKPNGTKIIVLDDGGELIAQMSRVSKKKGINIACVEQTTSGYEKLKKMSLNVGVINVARSKAKILFESKLVAKTAVQALNEKLRKMSCFPKKALIIGNGAIGQTLANALEGQCIVSLADICRKKSDKPYKSFFSHLSDFDIIIGCVGSKILSKRQIEDLKPGTLLMSLSSSDREFDIVEARKKLKNPVSCHVDFQCGNGVEVLNCGFPVNFSGNSEKVDIKEFELTRALLTTGILQTFELTTQKGLIALDEHIQLVLIREFSKKYKRIASFA